MRTSSTHSSLRATFQVMASVLSPHPAHPSGRVLVPVAPRLTQSAPEREETAAEHRRLGLVTRSSPCRRPHPTFREGRQGERAIWPLVPRMATHRPYERRREYMAERSQGLGEKGLTMWVERTWVSATVRYC